MIAKDISFFGRQNIDLRGNVEDIKDCFENPGNFLTIVENFR